MRACCQITHNSFRSFTIKCTLNATPALLPLPPAHLCFCSSLCSRCQSCICNLLNEFRHFARILNQTRHSRTKQRMEGARKGLAGKGFSQRGRGRGEAVADIEKPNGIRAHTQMFSNANNHPSQCRRCELLFNSCPCIPPFNFPLPTHSRSSLVCQQRAPVAGHTSLCSNILVHCCHVKSGALQCEFCIYNVLHCTSPYTHSHTHSRAENITHTLTDFCCAENNA